MYPASSHPEGIPAPPSSPPHAFVAGSQNGRVTDDSLPPGSLSSLPSRPSYRGHEARLSSLLSSFMKYGLVFAASGPWASASGAGAAWDKGARFSHSLARGRQVRSFSDVPSLHLTISQIGYGKKNDGMAELPPSSFHPSFHRSIAFFGSGGAARKRRGGCIDQPEEWRGRFEGRKERRQSA